MKNILDLYPSDNQTISRSSDYLFITKLLAHAQIVKDKRRKYFSLFFDETTSKYFYLREDPDKKYCNPITNNRVEILDSWKFKCNLRYNKVLKKFFEKIYDARFLLGILKKDLFIFTE